MTPSAPTRAPGPGRWTFLVPFAGALLLAWMALPDMPERLPVHWGADGQPDRWGSATESLFLSPMLLLPAALLMAVLDRYGAAGRPRNGVILNVTSLGLGLMALIETAGKIYDWNAMRTLLLSLGLLLALMGNHMGRAEPNAFVGLRTPWVFLSRRAWYASQRRSAIWMTTLGVLFIASSLLAPATLLVPWLTPIGMLLGMLLMAARLVYASSRDYATDPDPQPVDLRSS